MTTEFVNNEEQNIGYVDFRHKYYASEMFRRLNGWTDMRSLPVLLRTRHDDATDKILDLNVAQNQGHETSSQDLQDLIRIGESLCDWAIMHPLKVPDLTVDTNVNPNATIDAGAVWVSMIMHAAVDKKNGKNSRGFRRHWPKVIALYLKKIDLGI